MKLTIYPRSMNNTDKQSADSGWRKALNNRRIGVTLIILAFGLAGLLAWAPHATSQARRDAAGRNAAKQKEIGAAGRKKIAAGYARLPLHFEVNQGQSTPQVDFLSHGNGYSVFLTPQGALLSLKKHQGRKAAITEANAPKPARPARIARPIDDDSALIGLKLVGGNPKARVNGLEKLPGKINYYIGADRKDWRAGIPTYARVKYQSVYPGIDVVYYGNQRQLERRADLLQPDRRPRQRWCPGYRRG